jgi:HEAT repeat protein
LVGQLHATGSPEIFEEAVHLLTSNQATERKLGADVLGQLGYRERVPPFRKQSIVVLVPLLGTEAEPEVLEAVVSAVCQLYARSAIANLVRLAAHPSPIVRRALAVDLIHCTQERAWGDERPDPRVTRVLLLLSRDRASMVRNWACYSLGNSEQDCPELRDALAARLHDRHLETRVEAIAGLGKRADLRAVEPLLGVLSRRGWRLGKWVTADLVEFAGRTGDRRFLPHLVDFRDNWDLDPEELATVRRSIRGIEAVGEEMR